MQIPLQITFRHMEPSEALENWIREKAEKLERFYDRIISCRVVVEAPHHQHRQGNLYHVRIDVTVPNAELVTSREPDADHAYEDVYVAVRNGFDAMVRQLEDYARRQQGEMKSHLVPPHGRIARLVPEENFGIIDSSDGREIYFNRNSLVEADFEQLKVGDEVRFAEEQGGQGPQASSVRVVGKHHLEQP